MRRRAQGGFSLAEILVATAVALVVLLAAAAFFDFSTRQAGRLDATVDSHRIAQATLDHVVRTLRQTHTGTVVDNAANCLACHSDRNGALVDDPTTACPQDMSSPDPPIDIHVLTVDPASPGTPPVEGEPGNAISFHADIQPAPPAIPPGADTTWERRIFYPLVDAEGQGMVLQEDADYDGDGTADESDAVAYGVRDIRFTLEHRPAPVVAVGTPVSASCFQPGNPSGCHGTGNPFGEDVYGNGTKQNNGLGTVWAGNHPASQSVTGVRIRIRAGIQARQGADSRLLETTLEAVARPRGLDQ